jgi:ATP-dependent Zn protease
MATPPYPNERRKGNTDRRTMRGGLDPRNSRFGVGPLLLIFGVLIAVSLLFNRQVTTKVPYNELKNRIRQGQAREVVFTPTTLRAIPKDSALAREKGAWESPLFPREDPTLVPLLDQSGVPYRVEAPSPWAGAAMWLIPLVFLIFLWTFVIRRMNPTQGVLTVGRAARASWARRGRASPSTTWPGWTRRSRRRTRWWSS